MYCSKCGNEVVDEAVICTKCGCLLPGKNLQTRTAPSQQTDEISSTKKAAKVFMLIGLIFSAFSLIPLIWTIPMYNSYCNKIENGEKVETGFKVCCLLFVNAIAGLIMLCDND